MTRKIFILKCSLKNLCVRHQHKICSAVHQIRVHTLINTLVEADFSELSHGQVLQLTQEDLETEINK